MSELTDEHKELIDILEEVNLTDDQWEGENQALMDKMTSQHKVEKIAEFLGVSRDGEEGLWQLDGYPLDLMEEHRVRGVEDLHDFTYWLSSDAGTVAILNRLWEKYDIRIVGYEVGIVLVEIRPMNQPTLLRPIRAKSLNAALQALILEVIDEN